MIGRCIAIMRGGECSRNVFGQGLNTREMGDRGRLERIGAGTASSLQYEAAVDAALDAVADTLPSAVDLDALFGAARRPNVATCPTA